LTSSFCLCYEQAVVPMKDAESEAAFTFRFSFETSRMKDRKNNETSTSSWFMVNEREMESLQY